MTLAELADRIQATLIGDGSEVIHSCAPIDIAGRGQVTFLANQKYERHLEQVTASALIVSPDVNVSGVTLLQSDDPYFAFREAMVALHGFREHPGRPGDRAGGSSIAEDADVADDCIIHHGVVIEAGVSVGSGTVLYAGVYVGRDAVIGSDCIVHPNVVVYDNSRIGDRVIIHANSVIGSDGFGYATHDGVHAKIPQAGVVVLEDDVEIGGCCVIERAAMGQTRIGKGTKFADLISIGHGTTIGEHCLLVSLVGISGSVDVGNYVVLGGQVGVTGHLKIGDGVQVAGKAAVVGDLPPGARVAGVPAIDLEMAKRNALAGRDLYGLAKRVKQLERELSKLKDGD